jgi:peptidoglycan/xylan/chitin deacetylase (PgdA/CDA1 family)
VDAYFHSILSKSLLSIPMSLSRWPGGAKAAVSITMDNMGEALEIYNGVWPSSLPLGRHDSVHVCLPPMLDFFDLHKIKTTYFIEASNTKLYPTVIQDLVQRGHEVAMHGFQHEKWSTLTLEEESALFAKCTSYAKDVSVSYQGFRPPGGLSTGNTPELMRKYGMKYVSPAGYSVALVDGLVYLPFLWSLTDAYYYYEPLKVVRRTHGDGDGLISLATMKERMFAAIDQLVEEGQYSAVLFHPFLINSEDKTAVMQEIILHLINDSRIWVAPSCEIADWILKNPESFGNDPHLDVK